MLPLTRLTFWFLASRLFLLVVAWLGIRLVPPGWWDFSRDPLNWFNKWDAGWYLNVAKNGYFYDPNAQSTVAFFPLYPKLVHYVGLLVPDLRISGYLVSNALLFGSCLLLWKVVERDYGDRELADRSVLFLLFCPVTVFFSSIYSESTFLFLLLAVAWYAGSRRWLMAGAVGFFAALARSPGLLVSGLVAVEYGSRFYQGGKFHFRENFRWPEAAKVLVALALPALGLAVYMAFLQYKFGDWLAFAHTQIHWGRHVVAFWHLPWGAATYPPFYRIWFYESVVVAFIFTALAVAFRLRASHLALVFAFMLLYCSMDLLASFPRFLSVVFPFYIVAAEICLRHPRWERWFLGLSAALAALSTVLFVNGFWYT